MPKRSGYVGSCLTKTELDIYHLSDPCPNLCKYLVKGKESFSDMPVRIKCVKTQIVCEFALNKFSHLIIQNALLYIQGICLSVSVRAGLYFGLCVSMQVGVCVGVQCLP